MNIRKYHINEFPHDRVFVYLEENFHKRIFSRIRRYKFKDFNRIFFHNRLNWNTFKQWKSRKHFIPLWFVVKISEKFPEFSTEEFE